MKILVCIKQVPDQESRPMVNVQRTWAEYGDKTAYWINRYDEHAVEEALRIKDIMPETSIDIVSIGPQRVTSAIKRCIEMGADQGFHLYYDRMEYVSPSLKSQLIAEFCRNRKYDLILTGVMSEDTMSAQTGPMIAARLGIPSATSVIKLDVHATGGYIRVERELEAGHRCSLDLALPALIAVQSGINRPRYPSFSNVMRAKNTEIKEIRYDMNVPAGRYETVASIQEAASERAGIRLEGSTAEKAAALWQLLHEKSLI
ncbi:MAG: electron transfer flavoprotein subunit beta/FixA family protein [Syntrophomonadaceae bacterium]|jgi:electron transfer flavoprotein beta subunit|nr:electron transfer flavoprotein subunit beta/FixA family protein [Bacillota bacterium]HOQ10426.1 electron transfer flavoprotein subunit beta/FixA family protein [Syntrophomonadaceae bacterium]HPU49549.1 electron transfer flavoprotein subunit beta/FixA family protein [Syntrophomonadaceae bacterium]HQA08050.1 electron transfer flavoprotein subunit beta/FixA family protein [Syntrophomonadaceae bacterium]